MFFKLRVEFLPAVFYRNICEFLSNKMQFFFSSLRLSSAVNLKIFQTISLDGGGQLYYNEFNSKSLQIAL